MKTLGRLAALLVVAACGSSSPESKQPEVVPPRGGTAGDDILAMIPAGADSILELDVERLRNNPAVGELFRRLTASARAAPEPGKSGVNLFGAGDLVVFVSYDIGDDNTERLVIVRGPKVEISGSFRLDDNTVAIASGKMQKRLTLVAARQEPSLSQASKLLRLRALAMPEEAPGASLRLTAHLDFNARIALAKALDVDEVPVSLSVWGDVADDLAVVALVGGENEKEGDRLAASLASIRGRLSTVSIVRRLGLGRLIRSAEVERRGAAARLVLVIGPRRLGRIIKRILSRIGGEGSV